MVSKNVARCIALPLSLLLLGASNLPGALSCSEDLHTEDYTITDATTQDSIPCEIGGVLRINADTPESASGTVYANVTSVGGIVINCFNFTMHPEFPDLVNLGTSTVTYDHYCNGGSDTFDYDVSLLIVNNVELIAIKQEFIPEVTKVDGAVQISDNAALEILDNRGIQFIGQNLKIGNNPNLAAGAASFRSLESLDELAEYEGGYSLWLYQNGDKANGSHGYAYNKWTRSLFPVLETIANEVLAWGSDTVQNEACPAGLLNAFDREKGNLVMCQCANAGGTAVDTTKTLNGGSTAERCNTCNFLGQNCLEKCSRAVQRTICTTRSPTTENADEFTSTAAIVHASPLVFLATLWIATN